MNIPLRSRVLEMPTESVREELLYEYRMEVGLGRSIIYNLINFIYIINQSLRHQQTYAPFMSYYILKMPIRIIFLFDYIIWYLLLQQIQSSHATLINLLYLDLVLIRRSVHRFHHHEDTWFQFRRFWLFALRFDISRVYLPENSTKLYAIWCV